MSQLLNITDLRFKGGILVDLATASNPVVLLKRGQPVLAVIPYSELEEYELYLSQKQAFAAATKSTHFKKLFKQSNDSGLTETAQKWLQDKQIEEDLDSWEYADKVVEALAKESKEVAVKTNLKKNK